MKLDERNGQKLSDTILVKIEKAIPGMSVKQRRIATTILNDPISASFASVSSIAEAANVSPASVVRFSQQLIGKGFPKLQDELQKYIQKESNPIIRLKNNNVSFAESDYLLSNVYETQINNLVSMFNSGAVIKSVKRAGDLIYNAKKIYACGSRGSFSIAHYLAHHINRVFQNAQALSDDDRLADNISTISSDDIVILVCLPRYSSRLLAVAKYLYSRGIKLIVITDGVSSPFVQCSSEAIFVSYSSNDFHNSLIPSMLIAEMLISYVISKNPELALSNLHKIEKLFGDIKQYNVIERINQNE